MKTWSLGILNLLVLQLTYSNEIFSIYFIVPISFFLFLFSYMKL